MKEIDFMSVFHNSSNRDYYARINNPEMPKHKAAELAKRWDFDYWDGDRSINYGGYKYIPGRWKPLAQNFIDYYGLNSNSKILDIGCGKGFLMYEIHLLNPNINIKGLDISKYAIDNSKVEISKNIIEGSASKLPFDSNEFDFVFSINTLHCLEIHDLFSAISEINRVKKDNSYICVESYTNEFQKQNLLYWQVTCESFYSKKEWLWIYDKLNYNGDYSFIYFD